MEIIIKPITLALIGLAKLYQTIISPILPMSCRYSPTCSQYFIESLRSFGIFKGLRLTIRRVASCRPGGGCGYDPVPEKEVETNE
jgi:putative membrane protein insertion efficiency factor